MIVGLESLSSWKGNLHPSSKSCSLKNGFVPGLPCIWLHSSSPHLYTKSMVLPLPCFTAAIVKHFSCRAGSSLLVSSVQSTFFQMFAVSTNNGFLFATLIKVRFVECMTDSCHVD
ncbi:hypothetical protein ILYODFUR_023221 [Ilyodon furcidens]|uniref:Uncharacterized protein n=1 Tax=Ilyodon furcidens TaxID=33524 RepID=A0ABV0TDD8_9TELE